MLAAAKRTRKGSDHVLIIIRKGILNFTKIVPKSRQKALHDHDRLTPIYNSFFMQGSSSGSMTVLMSFHEFCDFCSARVSRRSLARILSTFLCALLIVLHPFSRFGGTNAFLVLSLKELVFSVQEDLAQQIEVTILNITGALLGIGVSTLAKFLATLFPLGSPSSRLIPALFLTVIAFFGVQIIFSSL